MIHHLSKVTEHLANSSLLEDALHGIAMFSCFSGRPSRFYLGRSLRDFAISYEMAMGFDNDFSCHVEYGEFIFGILAKGHPAHHSLLFLPHSDEYFEQYRERIGKNDHSKWKSTVLMQIVPDYFAALSTEIRMVEDIDTINYFNAIRSIITLYLRGVTDLQRQRSGSHPLSKESLNGVALTERQALILKMMESGDTNLAIAKRLGYSESLIRQETITIYRKMGISGRKELGL